MCHLGVCNERAACALRHHQFAISASSLGNVTVVSARDVRRHSAEDDLPSRPCSTHHPPDQLLRKSMMPSSVPAL